MTRKLLLSLVLSVLILAFAAVGSASAATVYVNINSTHPYPDGTSWETALTSVQAGINAAVAGDEVWVAKGTYYENIILKDGVALYGGFVGLETTREQRDFEINVTVLDGNQMESVVVVPENAASSTRIDGFTIRNGWGDYGGGISCLDNSSPTITNNKITGNLGYGGGIYCGLYSSPIITRNFFEENTHSGICCGYYGQAIITHNVLARNQASKGGGINVTGASPLIENNKIYDNFSSGGDGGGVYVYGGSSQVRNNIIVGNRTTRGGGIRLEFSNAQVKNNTIVGNRATDGGGIYTQCSYTSKPLIANNVISFNSSGIFNRLQNQDPSLQPTLKNNNLYGNDDYNYSTYVSPGTSDISADPLFVDRANGDYHLTAGSPCIDAGDDSVVQVGCVDIDGEPRIQGAHVDIGADEYPSDSVAPTTTIILKGTLGQNGWYISDVTVTLSATDTGSGVARTEYSLNGITWSTYSEPFTISDEGVSAVYYRSVDNAGNIEVAKQADIKIDKSIPFIYIGAPGNGFEYKLNQLILAQWITNDYISSIFSASGTTEVGQPIDTTSLGSKSFIVTTKDYAGHEATQTATYFVRYDYVGVLEPINQDGSSIYEIGSGRTIPVKFHLKDANDNYISTAAAKLYLAKISDTVTGTDVEAVSTDPATDGNTFIYDSVVDQYVFNLDTTILSIGTWELRIVLDDGTTKTVRLSAR